MVVSCRSIVSFVYVYSLFLVSPERFNWSAVNSKSVTETSPSFDVFFLNPELMPCLSVISSEILLLNLLYVETVSSIMLDVSHMTVPPNISDLFTKAKQKHMHNTRFKLKGLLPNLELIF